MRGGLGVIDKRLATIREEIRQSEAGVRLAEAEQRQAEMKQTIADLEAKVRELALEAYQVTGEKKVAPGVGIRVNTSHSYSVAEMYVWCEANAPAFILHSVDAKAIGKVAKSLQERGAPIILTEEPTATIATDLDKALSDN
jgi:hypothetical protein